MNKLYIFLFILLLVLGCLFIYFGTWSIEGKIGKEVENCQPNTDCIIKIVDITDFQWEKMYVFDYGMTDEEIEETLGTKYGGHQEFKRKLVFIKDGKVVYREYLLTHISEAVDEAVQFEGLEFKHPLSFAPDTAIFRAGKYTIGDGNINYNLKQIE